MRIALLSLLAVLAACQAATPSAPAAQVATVSAAPPQPAIAPAASPAAPATPAQVRASPPPLPSATTPVPPRTPARHEEFLAVAKAGSIDLLFVGDSITDWWRQDQRGKPVWDKTWGSLKPANFGIAGDTTQGVLWRMQNGELDGFKAKL